MYLAVVLLLAALIVCGVAFEYRGKRDAARWRHTWDRRLICLLHGETFLSLKTTGDMHERSRLEGLRVPPLEHRDGFFAATTVTIAACRRVSREEFLPASEPAPEPTTATDAAVRLPVSEAEGKGP